MKPGAAASEWIIYSHAPVRVSLHACSLSMRAWALLSLGRRMESGEEASFSDLCSLSSSGNGGIRADAILWAAHACMTLGEETLSLLQRTTLSFDGAISGSSGPLRRCRAPSIQEHPRSPRLQDCGSARQVFISSLLSP